MNTNKYFKKITLTIICAFGGEKLRAICPILILFMMLMVVDYISGMLAAEKEAMEHPNSKKYGWNSKQGLAGIYKKVGYMFTVLVAISTDYLIFCMIEEIGVEYQTKTMFGLMVLIWFILNESLSILENVGRMGVKMPKFLARVLTNLKNNINENK